MPLEKLLTFEMNLWAKGCDYIAGIDEVGRGALAGPMVVAAVIINKKHLIEDNFVPRQLEDEHIFYHKINDSKQVTPINRHYISERLIKELIDYSIVEISNSQIDSLGISECTQLAFTQAVEKLTVKPQHILTDSFEIKKFSKSSQTNIIKGDCKSITIAAASILAKVYRDKLMSDLGAKYEQYDFKKHKGYGTVAHRQAIAKFGYSDIHRMSYKVNLNTE